MSLPQVVTCVLGFSLIQSLFCFVRDVLCLPFIPFPLCLLSASDPTALCLRAYVPPLGRIVEKLMKADTEG